MDLMTLWLWNNCCPWLSLLSNWTHVAPEIHPHNKPVSSVLGPHV
jgi:hypothetical protein